MKNLLTGQTGRAATIALFFLLLLTVSASRTLAQTPDGAEPGDAAQGNQDANWVTALGLTPEQVARIRAIRMQNRAEWQAAKQRVNQAQRALDQAIYSDEVSEAVIEQRSREVAEAQAAEVRLRAMTELGIRRVLTLQQLNTFRTIREQRIREAQMKRRMENAGQRRPPGDRRPGNAINQPLMNDRPDIQPGEQQGDRGAAPLLGPRQRRGGLPRRIRP
ncbi:MAG TPA: Spy/CpxP family protein refolding chaperone [Pyrinomonadaceae bacterium]|nr:Spy/CpxP family protein refolding chaperone [Pyrinomonadaceae bacterium]